jgi:hypothetical protein
MASYEDKNGKSKKPPKPKDAPFVFINYNLSTKDKEWLQACDAELEFPVKGMLDLVQEGYKLSISADPKNNSFIASLTDREPTSGFHNHCLTGRGATPFDAWVSLAYRHFVVGQGSWANLTTDSDGKPSKYS